MDIQSIIQQDFLTFDEDAALSEMIGQLKQFEKRAGLVFKNKKYKGLVEKKWMLRSRLDASKTKLKHFLQPTPLLNEHADVIETSYLFYQSNVDLLPIERNKQIIGVIWGLDLASLATKLPEAKQFTVADIKLVKPSRVEKDDAVATATSIMYEEHVDHVPVYEQGKLYGIFSYRDFLRKYLNWSPHRDVSAKFNKIASSRSAEVDMSHLASLPVANFSTNDNLLTITEGKKLREAVALMVQHNVSDLMVMREQKVQGLLTVKNILRRFGSLKIPKNFNIRFVGLNQVHLEPYQKYNLQKIAANEAMKLQRRIHNQFALTIHIKEYEREGTQHKYSVNMRVEFPGQIITSTQDDWDIETALRKTFENAHNKTKSKFRGDSSRKKNYYYKEMR